MRALIITIVVFLYSGVFQVNGLIPVSLATTNMLAVLLSVGLLLSGWRAVLQLVWETKTLPLFSVLAVVSSTWALFPDLTLRRSLILLGATGLGFYVAAHYALHEQVILYSRMLLIAMFISLLTALILPEYGLHQNALHLNRWRGVLPHKNILGEWMAMATTLFLFLPAGLLRMRPVYKYVAAALAAVMMVLSVSVTSMIACLLVIALVPVLLTLRLDVRLRVAGLCFFAVSVLVVSVLLLLNLPYVLDLFGRTDTLSGRLLIWPVIGALIEERLITGYGYMSFFGGEFYRVDLAFQGGWNPEHAHNVWLDLAVDLGLVGVVMFALIVLRSARQLLLLLLQSHRVDILLAAILLLNILTRSMTETLAYRRRDLIWVMFVSVTLGLVRVYSQYRAERSERADDLS